MLGAGLTGGKSCPKALALHFCVLSLVWLSAVETQVLDGYQPHLNQAGQEELQGQGRQRHVKGVEQQCPHHLLRQLHQLNKPGLLRADAYQQQELQTPHDSEAVPDQQELQARIRLEAQLILNGSTIRDKDYHST